MTRLACTGRIFRRQWLALSLVHAVCDCVDAEAERDPIAARNLPGLEDGMTVERMVGKVRVARGRCARCFEGPDGAVTLDPQQQKALDRAVMRMGKVISRAWPGDEVPARAWLNAVILVVEDVAAQVPVTSVERFVNWSELLTALLKLYSIWDPSWDSDEIEAGAQAGEQLKAIVFG